jgi:hypothetical protein
MLMSAGFLKGKAKRPPLIGYHPAFFMLCVCNESLLGKKKVCVAQTNGTPTKRWRAVSSLKIKGIPFRLPCFNKLFIQFRQSFRHRCPPNPFVQPSSFFLCLQKRTHGSRCVCVVRPLGCVSDCASRVPLLLFSPSTRPAK